jgi:hypothetical protein
MKSMSKYLIAFLMFWIVNTLPVVASEWAKVSGDELKAAVNNKQWKSTDFTLHWRSDGKRLQEANRGARRVDKWWIESDETTICYKHKKLGTRCSNLEKKGDKYRMVVTKSGEGKGKKWKISIKDGIDDF